MNPLTELEKQKGSLFFLYLGKLVEFGILEKGQNTLTEKGFNIAIDAYDAGLRLTTDEIAQYVLALENDMEAEHTDMIYELVIHLQHIGFQKMKEEIAEFKSITQEIRDKLS